MLCDIVWLQEEIAADGLRIVEPPLLLDDALDDEDFDDALDDEDFDDALDDEDFDDALDDEDFDDALDDEDFDDALDDEDFDDALDDIQCAVCGDPECSTEQHTDEWKDGQWQGF